MGQRQRCPWCGLQGTLACRAPAPAVAWPWRPWPNPDRGPALSRPCPGSCPGPGPGPGHFFGDGKPWASFILGSLALFLLILGHGQMGTAKWALQNGCGQMIHSGMRYTLACQTVHFGPGPAPAPAPPPARPRSWPGSGPGPGPSLLFGPGLALCFLAPALVLGSSNRSPWPLFFPIIPRCVVGSIFP